jgi:hypothetical protein
MIDRIKILLLIAFFVSPAIVAVALDCGALKNCSVGAKALAVLFPSFVCAVVFIALILIAH